MTDLYPPRRRVWLRTAGLLAVVAAAGAGAFTIGRHLPPATAAVTVGTPAPPWPAPTARPAAPVDTTDTAGLPAAAATARTGVGVPYGWPDSDAGAADAAVVAVKAGMWFKYTLPDPWEQLGFLAAARQQTADRTARVTAFLTDPAPTPPAATTGGPGVGGPCGCGLAVVAAALPAGQVAADQGFATVRVTVVAFTTAGSGVSATVSVVRVLLHWEGDWKLADAGVEPDAAGASILPAGVPLPAPTWQA